MRCGLFGKLAAKRDFIALGTSRAFLEVWEPWVQACMSASQHQLGARWQNAYLTSPLWRFWLGADIAGMTVTGVVMPSVDGVGRYYPLTVLAASEPDFSIPPPDLDPQDLWFTAAETFLLSTLERETSFEQIATALDALPVPGTAPTVDGHDDVIRVGEATAAMVAAGKSFRHSLALMRRNNHATSAAAAFWWTEGGGDFPPMSLASRGLLDPFCYTAMLTGAFAAPDDSGVSC